MTVDVLPETLQVSRLSAEAIGDARVVMADLDGCLIADGIPFPDAQSFVEACGDRLWIISNNSSHTAEALSADLAEMGLQVAADRILLAGEQTLHHVHAMHPGQSVTLYASDCLKAQAQAIGVKVGTEVSDADIVILCRDVAFALPQMEHVAVRCQQGVRLWVSNTDTAHPGQDGRSVPETGALLAALHAIIGDVRFECIGKPHGHMAQSVLRRTGVAVEDVVFLGDNADTDGAIARSMGMRFVHVVREGAA